MRILRRLASIAILIGVCMVVFQNQEMLGRSTEVVFLRWRVTLVMGFWLLFSFVAGVLSSLLLDAWRNIGLRWKMRKLEQELATTRVPTNPPDAAT